jgi:hypothetical protein
VIVDAPPAPARSTADAGPGRSCPLHYRYRPEVFASPAPPELRSLDVLYVVGGLYGNELALERVLSLFERERGRKRLVFNGDFHWFDADPAIFERVQRGVLRHVALRGNVETELAAGPAAEGDGVDSAAEGEASDAGCGCAYPEWVGDAVVERSNRILCRLRGSANPAQRVELAALPMWLRADVGDFRVGIVHGDACSLAGWGFAQERLRDPAHRAEVRGWLRAADVDAFACTHTCLPVFEGLRDGAWPGQRWILNNGAAGMPNFAGDGAGLLTRIALAPYAGAERRFGVRPARAFAGAAGGAVSAAKDGVFADAIAIETDAALARSRFLAQWPEGSDAHASYFGRIAHGPLYAMTDAVRIED